LCVLFRHIFAFARNCFAVSLSQKQKRLLPVHVMSYPWNLSNSKKRYWQNIFYMWDCI